MHEQTADTDRFGRVNDPVCGVLKQGASQPAALMPSGNRESCEHYHRDRIGHIAAKAPGRRVGRHGTGCQSVVSGDFASIEDDECSRCATGLVA